ncbi:MAG: polysaccharide biosynthesis/export family protein [Bryobacteraceae bacterium]
MSLTRLGSLVLATTLAGFALQAPSPPAKPDPSEQLRSTYVLGPEDQIAIRALEAEEISDKPIRIDMSGNIRLPMVGRIHAAGLTLEQFEAQVSARLKTYINDPEVSVSIVEFRSQPISVIGSVRNPGVHQLQGRKTLVEILSLAGGLAPDAGHSVKITRLLEWGRIPLPGAADDSSGQFSVAQVSLRGIMEAKAPEQNILVRPHDVISVPRAEMVYVIGQVQRSGGFILNERENLSVLKALSLAGGLDHTASPKNARILRAASGASSRLEIPVDLKKILSGQTNDVPLQPEDILFVPSNLPKKALVRAVETAVQMGTGLVIWRR